MTDLAELWREWQEAGEEVSMDDLDPEDSPAWVRYDEADAAIRSARPTDLAGLAIQVRLLADSICTGHLEDDIRLALSIAERLEELAAQQ